MTQLRDPIVGMGPLPTAVEARAKRGPAQGTGQAAWRQSFPGPSQRSTKHFSQTLVACSVQGG